MRIEIYRQSYFVYDPPSFIIQFIKQFKTYRRNEKGKKIFYELEYRYYGNIIRDNCYIFNIVTIRDFLSYINDISNIDIINKGIHDVKGCVTIDVKLNPKFKLRSYQSKSVNFIYKDSLKLPTVLIDLHTGAGKTLIACAASVKIKKRTGIIILPNYIDKWIEDITKNTTATIDDIIVIQGSKKLIKLMEMKNKDIPKYVIFSNRTMINYIHEFEQAITKKIFDNHYPIEPINLFHKLKIGTLIFDEVHQEFYSIYKIILYTNVRYIIGMSATLITNVDKLEKLYIQAFPPAGRISLVTYKPYIHVYAVRYKLQNVYNLKVETTYGYSHIKFELYIVRNEKLMLSYFKLIKDQLDKHYINRRNSGDRVMVFVQIKKLATKLVKYLKTKYKYLDIRRYMGEDPYKNVMEPDIIVTTIGSAGTAVDVKNLITVIQTVSMNSEKANIQVMGRLRFIEDKEMRFVYLWCGNINKHETYHRNKIKLLGQKAKEYNHEVYNTPLLV